jgi:probable rRNA maturation factor
LIEIEIEDPAWAAALTDVEALVRTAANATLLQQEASVAIVILLADDAALRDLNARFRDKDAATNVLSFPAAPNPENLLGDVALAFGVCAREAAQQGKLLAHHLQHLTVHGVLHLLGHDHIDDDEAGDMEALERTVLAQLGVPDPYLVGEGEHERP